MVLERIYTIPLRKEFQKAPKYKRTKRAINAIKTFSLKHMKADVVKIGKYLNLEMWKHGKKNPPPRIQVKMIKDKEKDLEVVKVELINAPVEKKVEVKKKGLKERLLEKATGKEPSLKKNVHEEKPKEEKVVEKKEENILEKDSEKTEEKPKKEKVVEKTEENLLEKRSRKEEEKDLEKKKEFEKEKKDVLEHEKPKEPAKVKEAPKIKENLKDRKEKGVVGRTSKK